MLQISKNSNTQHPLHKRLLVSIGSIGAATVLLLPHLAAAQAGGDSMALEEIVVTAQKREENLQQTPVAVTAVSAETLANINADTFSDIARIAPSVQVGGLNANQLVIRGVGQQQPGLFSEQGAAIYVDGVYRPRFIMNSINFSSVARMEVLRGPQGTLYGKNAVGGAINIVTRAPGNDFGGDLQAQYGSRDHRKFDAAMNIPLVTDRLAAYLSYNYNKQDGYIDNLYTGGKLSDTNYYAVHAGLRLNVTDNLSLTLQSDYYRQEQSGVGYVLLDASRFPPVTFAARDAILRSYRTNDDYANQAGDPSQSLVNDKGASLTLDWSVGPGTLKSITAYRKYDDSVVSDADGTPLVARSNPSQLSQHFVSEEINFNGAALSDALKYTVGVFYYNEDGKNPSRALDNGDNTAVLVQTLTTRTQETTSSAVFGQATYTFFEKLGLTLGARYSKEKKDVTAITTNLLNNAVTANVAGNADWSSFTPKVTVQYQFTPDVMSYATVSRGFKAGGFNTSTNFFQPYDPEYLWNYELGLKSEWFGHRLRANLTAYQMNYDNIQLNQIAVVNPTTGQTAPIVRNAGDARIRGGEAELAVLVVDGLLLNAGFGVNDFEYTKLAPGVTVTTSNVLPNAPKYSYNAGAEYSFAVGTGRLAMNGHYSHRSKTYFDAGNNELTAQDSYGLLSARITYEGADERWSVFAYGNNLTDEYYRVAGFAAAGVYSVIPGAPREVGVGFNLSFGAN